MSGPVDRGQIQAELAEVFDARTAERLAAVLVEFAQRLRGEWLRGENEDAEAAAGRVRDRQRRPEKE